MTRKKYTEEQIINILREAEAKVGDLCRRYSMSNASFYNWKSEYAGLTVNELKQLKALEEENRRLKQIVAVYCSPLRHKFHCGGLNIWSLIGPPL